MDSKRAMHNDKGKDIKLTDWIFNTPNLNRNVYNAIIDVFLIETIYY